MNMKTLYHYCTMGVLAACLNAHTTLAAVELPDFSGLVTQYGPAVVNISTTTNPGGAKKSPKDNSKDNPDKSPKQPFDFKDIPGIPKDSPFHDFFRHFFDEEGNGGDFLQRKRASLGSGFIISTDGYVVTNHHVVAEADEIVVRLNDRRELPAKVIGSDERSDVALLKVEAANLPVVQLHKHASENLKVGEWVLAIGSPFGFDHSVTAGIVSAKGRSLPGDETNYVPFIQTDVAINPGNSGGPLFNLRGEVVGVNAQIYSRTGGFMGLSFAIPADVVLDVIDQLKTTGKVSRGWLGVLIQEVDGQLAESFGMDKPRGALISKILANGVANQAGFKVGDVVIEFDGKPIDHASDLPPIVGAVKAGQTIRATVLREGKPVELSVTVAELPADGAINLAAGGQANVKDATLGLTIADLNAETRKRLEVPEHGVLVEQVEPSGPAAKAGMEKEDVVLMLDNQTVENAAHFKKITQDLKSGQAVAVLVHRQGSPRFLAVRIP